MRQQERLQLLARQKANRDRSTIQFRGRHDKVRYKEN